MIADTTIAGERARAIRNRYQEPMHATELGRRLRSVREAAGLTQGQLGARMGDMPQSTISAYENAVNEPNLETVWAWAKACGRDPRLEFAPAGEPTPLGALIDLPRPLPPEEVVRLARIAKALADPSLGERTRENLTRIFEGAVEDAKPKK